MEEISKQGEGQPIDQTDQEKLLVYDSSVDHKGKVPLRASTGVWKASRFIIGKEYESLLMHVTDQ